MYILDTNIISYWMRGNQSVIQRIKQYSPSELSLSTISLAEILYGIEKSPIKKQERTLKIQHIASLLQLYPFDSYAASAYALIRTGLEQKGTPISERDTQIASVAMANKLILITHNMKEFLRVKNLHCIDWAENM